MYRWGAQWGQCLRHTTNEFFFLYVKHYDNNFTENNAQTNWIFTVSIFSRILNALFVFHFFFHTFDEKRFCCLSHCLMEKKKSVLHELLNVFDQNGNKTSENRKRNYCWTVATRHEHMCTSFVVNICSFFFWCRMWFWLNFPTNLPTRFSITELLKSIKIFA